VSIPVTVEDGGGKGRKLTLSPNGEVLTRSFDYSDPVFNDMDLPDTAYNFFRALGEKQYVITAIALSTNKNIGVNGATVIVYEASDALTTTVDKVIHETNLLKNDRDNLTGLEWLVNKGKFISAKTDDDDVFATIAAYPIPALPIV